MSIPPVIPVEPAADSPPLSIPTAPEPKGVSALLLVALVLVGAILLLLSLAASGLGPDGTNVGYRIGRIIGAMVAWPLIVIGLFSIGRRFRTTRARAIILLVVWAVSILGQLGSLGARAPNRSAARSNKDSVPAAPTVFNEPVRERLDLQSAQATPATPQAVAAPSPNYDFSPGSDQRLGNLIENAQEERYHAIVIAYAKACEARHNDDVLALERVRFIARFAHAEDVVIASAEADYETACTYLETQFPDAPGTVLFTLEHAFGPEFEKKAILNHEQARHWPAVDAAKFLLLRAQHTDTRKNPALTRGLASLSFRHHPTPEAGMLLANALFALGRPAEALATLQHSTFNTAPDWIKKQKMDLLFDLKEAKSAVATYEDLKKTAPAIVRNHDTAMRLAGAGRVPEGRALLAEMSTHQWNRDWLSRQRFEFELKFGTEKQAQGAYRELRATGFGADPLARDRFELFRQHPLAGWSLTDALGVLLFILTLAAVAALPLLLIAPVHHWSLWRERTGNVATWNVSPWGLKAAWFALGAACVGEMVAIWLFQPDVIRGWGSTNRFQAAATHTTILANQTLLWSVLGILVLALIVRARMWRVLGPGLWRARKAVGVGVAVAVALRIAVVIYVLFVPGIRPAISQLSPVTTELVNALLKAIGPLGLMLVIGLFVPLMEEMLVRGVVLGALAKHVPFWAANTLQAIGFALLHESWWLAPFFFVFAFLAGEMVRRSHGLLAPIALHVTNNTIACLGIIALHGRNLGLTGL